MKRFWLFHYDYYYPAGGFGDFEASLDTAEEALSEGRKLRDLRMHSGQFWSEAHVIDSQTGVQVDVDQTEKAA